MEVMNLTMNLSAYQNAVIQPDQKIGVQTCIDWCEQLHFDRDYEALPFLIASLICFGIKYAMFILPNYPEMNRFKTIVLEWSDVFGVLFMTAYIGWNLYYGKPF